MKLSKIFAIVALVSPLLCHAVTYSEVTTVKALTFNQDGVRVKLESMKSAESCENQNFYYLPTPTNQQNKLISALLTAKASKGKISLQLVGCENMGSYSYPKINHIYFCDTVMCN